VVQIGGRDHEVGGDDAAVSETDAGGPGRPAVQRPRRASRTCVEIIRRQDLRHLGAGLDLDAATARESFDGGDDLGEPAARVEDGLRRGRGGS
jgi:hypothetical protein